MVKMALRRMFMLVFLFSFIFLSACACINNHREIQETHRSLIAARNAREGTGPKVVRLVYPDRKTSPKLYVKEIVKVNFDLDKAIIKKSEKKKLIKAIDYVKRHFYTFILIEGHACSISTIKYNQGLSEKRARALKSFLIRGGIKESRIIMTDGYSELLPDKPNKTNKGRKKNRRTEIVIVSR